MVEAHANAVVDLFVDGALAQSAAPSRTRKMPSSR
jgi:hypothetical protein